LAIGNMQSNGSIGNNRRRDRTLAPIYHKRLSGIINDKVFKCPTPILNSELNIAKSVIVCPLHKRLANCILRIALLLCQLPIEF